MLSKIYDQNSCMKFRDQANAGKVAKGQDISEENYLVLNLTKTNEFFSIISALASKKWLNQKIKALYGANQVLFKTPQFPSEIS